MAKQNLVSGSISEETQKEILQALADIQRKLDFLITLHPDQIKPLVKANNGYAPMIDRAYEVVNQHPEILPPVFDVKEFKRDYELIKALTIIALYVDELADGIQKTLIAARSDAMMGSLEVYAAIRQHQDKVPGLNVVAEEMAVFFPRKGKKARPPKV